MSDLFEDGLAVPGNPSANRKWVKTDNFPSSESFGPQLQHGRLGAT